MSEGWIHYEMHAPEPNILLFKRPREQGRRCHSSAVLLPLERQQRHLLALERVEAEGEGKSPLRRKSLSYMRTKAASFISRPYVNEKAPALSVNAINDTVSMPTTTSLSFGDANDPANHQVNDPANHHLKDAANHHVNDPANHHVKNAAIAGRIPTRPLKRSSLGAHTSDSILQGPLQAVTVLDVDLIRQQARPEPAPPGFDLASERKSRQPLKRRAIPKDEATHIKPAGGIEVKSCEKGYRYQLRERNSVKYR
ncbi:MAG: hypothetical protein SGCHY_005544 [Lobulomycetales sp.]